MVSAPSTKPGAALTAAENVLGESSGYLKTIGSCGMGYPQAFNLRFPFVKADKRFLSQFILFAVALILAAFIFYSNDDTNFDFVEIAYTDSPEYFVNIALRPWRSMNTTTPVTKEKVDFVYHGHSEGEFCQVLQILNGTIFLTEPNYEGHAEWLADLFQRRVEAIVDVTKRAVDLWSSRRGEKHRQINTEFVFCAGDCVASQSHDVEDTSSLLPDFSVVKCRGSGSIPIPLFDVYRPPNDVSLSDWNDEIKVIKANRLNYTWEQRRPQMVFRGDARSCFLNATDDGYNPTETLFQSIYSGIRSSCGRPLAKAIVAEDQRFNFESPPVIGMPDHEQFKYVMYIHGHCHWANRLRRFLFMGMALFKQAGLCDEFYALGLRPWIHYIPVDYAFKNLSKSMEYAVENEEAVLSMIKRMNEYSEKVNTAEFAINYMMELLNSYSLLLDYTPTLRQHSRPV